MYKALRKDTKEEFAIKCLDMDLISDPFLIKSLKTEIDVMKRLKSENVVKYNYKYKKRMYDVIYETKMTYIVLELCPDGDLDRFI